jgi:hypothetical protein
MSKERMAFEVREIVYARTGVEAYNWPEAARHLVESSVITKENLNNIVTRVISLIEKQTDPR